MSALDQFRTGEEQVAKELGVDAGGLYRPVHKLVQEGAIIKRGAALQPTSD